MLTVGTASAMSDDPFTTPGRVMPARVPRPGELLFQFVRASDRASLSCELRFHGESFGWEAQFLERGELLMMSASGETWHFEADDNAQWRRVPDSADPLILLRQ